MRALTLRVLGLVFVFLATSSFAQTPDRKLGAPVVPDTFRMTDGTLLIVSGDTAAFVGRLAKRSDVMTARYIMTDTSFYLIIPGRESRRLPKVVEETLRIIVKSFVDEKRRGGARD